MFIYSHVLVQDMYLGLFITQQLVSTQFQLLELEAVGLYAIAGERK